MRTAPSWTARDWRQFVALTLLAAGDFPLSFLLGWTLGIVSANPRNGAALTLGLGMIGLIAINRIGISAVLGRRTFRFKVGDAAIDASGGAAERVLDQAEGER